MNVLIACEESQKKKGQKLEVKHLKGLPKQWQNSGV